MRVPIIIKQSAPKLSTERLFKNIPSMQRIIFLRGSGAENKMKDAILTQPMVQKVINVSQKMIDWAYNSGVKSGKINPSKDAKPNIREIILDQLGARSGEALFSSRALGTVGSVNGKKKLYIDMDLLNTQKGVPLREVFVHENFHLRPIVGHSESLAHIAGGAYGKTRRPTILQKMEGAARGMPADNELAVL